MQWAPLEALEELDQSFAGHETAETRQRMLADDVFDVGVQGERRALVDDDEEASDAVTKRRRAWPPPFRDAALPMATTSTSTSNRSHSRNCVSMSSRRSSPFGHASLMASASFKSLLVTSVRSRAEYLSDLNES